MIDVVSTKLEKSAGSGTTPYGLRLRGLLKCEYWLWTPVLALSMSAFAESNTDSLSEDTAFEPIAASTAPADSVQLGAANPTGDTVDVSYRDFTIPELNAEMNEIARLSPTQRRALLMEVQRRMRTVGHEPFVQGEHRFGRVDRPQKTLDAVPVIEEEVRIVRVDDILVVPPEKSADGDEDPRDKNRANRKQTTYEKAYTQ